MKFQLQFSCILVGMLLSCELRDDKYRSNLAGTWQGSVIETQELSYKFDSRGYLPTKVIDLPIKDHLQLSFEGDSVLVDINGDLKKFYFSVDKTMSPPEVVFQNADTTKKLKIDKITQDQLVLVKPETPGSQVLSVSYSLKRL